MENHVDRNPKLGAWVLINAAWYKCKIQSLEYFLRDAFSGRGDLFYNAQGLKDEVLNELNSIGAMNDGVPSLLYLCFIDDALVWSGNKLESINAISELESKSLGKSSRLVVLTDWCRRWSIRDDQGLTSDHCHYLL